MAVQNFYFFGSYNAFIPFIMEVESGSDNKFTIPTTGGGYNYSVKTSDGQNFSGQTGNLTITFPNSNTLYDIEISGLFPRIYFNNGSERLKIKEIKQWGDIEWTSFEGSFFNCNDLTCSATDIPKFSNGIRMNEAFMGTKINPTNIASWQWSKVSNIRKFLYNNSFFNQDISNLDFSGIPNDGVVAVDRCFELFISNATSFNNNSQRLIIDFLSKTHFLGTYPFNTVKVTQYEFKNSENLSWSNALQSGERAIVEVIIFHNRQTDIDFKTGVNNYPNLIPSGVKETIDAVDKTAGKILSLNPTVYANFETYIQGLGYIDIADYLTQTSNTWTVIN
jgi:hypothetical protein